MHIVSHFLFSSTHAILAKKGKITFHFFFLIFVFEEKIDIFFVETRNKMHFCRVFDENKNIGLYS
jgi:hypothetical protein